MNSIFKKHWFWLLVILLISTLLRIWKLGSVPPHLTADEAGLGYNAYSILKTGKDFWGQSFPIIFKTFGDYTPGLYVYLTAPFVAIFGLTEFGIRIPNAILGSLNVYFIYLISRIVFKNAKYQKFQTIALLSGFLAAVNPWLIHFSRGAWVPNLALTLTLGGVYFFLKSFEKSKFLIVSAVLFALTTLSYQGAKLSTALVVVLLGIIFFDRLKKMDKKIILGSFAAGIIITFPILASFFTGQAGRLSVVSVFSYPRSSQNVQSILAEGDEGPQSATSIAFHTEPLNFVRVVLGKWFNHFSGRFLFFEGDWDNPRHNSPNMGMLLLVDSFLIISGLVYFMRGGKNKYLLFILLWLVVAPLPSIFSRDRVHGVRSLHMAIPLVIISALALQNLLSNSKKAAGKVAILVFVGLYVLNYIYYLDAYFVHLPNHNAKYWEYGYKQAVEFIDEKGLNSRKIVFQQNYAQPFIFFLFYQRWDASVFRESAIFEGSSVGDVGLVSKAGNIDFQFLSWPYKYPAGTIVVADEIVAPRNLAGADYNILKEVLRPDGSLAFLVMEAK